MRVLLVTNFASQQCGISNYGHQMTYALTRAGCEVTEWDGNYSVIYEKIQREEPAYLPPDAASYDVIHFIWHPITCNHYLTLHWPTAGALRSIMITDLPPDTGCPCLPPFHVRMAAQATDLLRTPQSPGLAFPYPITDWVGDLPDPNPTFTVGWTGIRGDGRGVLEAICTQHGWAMNFTEPGVWLPLEEEIRRLARSTVNVCWYDASRGIAGAPMTNIASRRPLLLNSTPMFQHLSPYRDEIYQEMVPQKDVGALERSLGEIAQAWAERRPLKIPSRVYRELGWTRAAELMIHTWKEARR